MTRREYISRDVRMGYYKPLSKAWWLEWLLKSEQYYLKCYMRALRSEEFYLFEKPCKTWARPVQWWLKILIRLGWPLLVCLH